MQKAKVGPKRLEISCVLPTYNESKWLEETCAKLNLALSQTDIETFELIIVNDGSSDDTNDVVRAISEKYPQLHIQLVEQQNMGRFRARYAGVSRARYENLLLLDSRVHIHQNALAYLVGEIARHPDLKAWNGHVVVDKTGNIYARFWEAITGTFWSSYLKDPRRLTYTLKEFDNYPKGTGFFFVPTEDFLNACKQFLKKSGTIRHSSDDTYLLRAIAAKYGITISPKFSCTYHSRTSLNKFLKHAFYRGQFFVDGYFRKGTRFFLPLLGVYVATPLILLALAWPILTRRPDIFIFFMGVPLIVYAILFVVMLSRKVSVKDTASLLVLLPFFSVVYLAGLWVGLLRRLGIISDKD